jgi:hypothetical protein
VLAEAYFEHLAQDRGWTISHATAAEDRTGWDFLIARGDQQLKVDVKSMKRISRSDSFGQDRYIWIELSKGENSPGWIYKSAADVFAFETSEDFILVRKQDLVELVERVVDKSLVTVDRGEAVNKVYQRKKLHGPGVESLTLVESKAVRKIAAECWDKTDRMKGVDQQQCDHVTTSESSLHQEAIRSIKFKSPRLRAQRESEIKQTIEEYKYCPRCSAKLI